MFPLPRKEAYSTMVSIYGELLRCLPKMTELNSRISMENADLAMKLSDFEKGVRKIGDYYCRIIASTKAIVSYCSDKKVIPQIIKLIEEKRYLEAEKEIKCFLRCVKMLIKRVATDIETTMLTSSGSEVHSAAGSFSKGLGSVIETANLSSELRKITKLNSIEICHCLSEFFEQLKVFKSNITDIEKFVDERKLDLFDLHNDHDGWANKQEDLQFMFENFTDLSTNIL